jgi:hypothetical protein
VSQIFSPTRGQARQFFFETWRRYKAGEPLEGLQQAALQVILLHAEYHPLLDQPDRYTDADWPPEAGTLNPFLHLSLHLAVQEQLSIDQPQGVRENFVRLRAKLGDEHDALHSVVECLGETVWQAQRDARLPDEVSYLDCLRRRLGASSP